MNRSMDLQHCEFETMKSTRPSLSLSLSESVHRILVRNANLPYRVGWKRGRARRIEDEGSSRGQGQGRDGLGLVVDVRREDKVGEFEMKDREDRDDEKANEAVAGEETATAEEVLVMNSSDLVVREDVDHQRYNERHLLRDPNPDPDLSYVLSLATPCELERILEILHAPSLTSPVIKSLVMRGSANKHAYELQYASREEVERYIEAWVRFLAADAGQVLRRTTTATSTRAPRAPRAPTTPGGPPVGRAATRIGTYPSYRELLLGLRERLRVDCRKELDTADLEMEVFLGLVERDREREREGADWDVGSMLTRNALGTLVPLALTHAQLCHLDSLAGLVMERAAVWRAVRGVYTGASASMGASVEVGRRVVVERARGRLAAALVGYGVGSGVYGVVSGMVWGWWGWGMVQCGLGADWDKLGRVVAVLAQVRLLRTNGWR